MSAIRGKNTKPEIYIRKLLFSKGFRYRVCSPAIIGKPDIWLAKYHTAIFVHGCYWHRHVACRYAYTPKSNVDFWIHKFEENVARDLVVKEQLKDKRIKCIVIWECTIKKMQKDPLICEENLSAIISFFTSEKLFLEM